MSEHQASSPQAGTFRSRFQVEREGSRRDARVDTMRGVFLMLMIIDHLGGFWSKHVTWQPLGLVSAAEGFVFLSGCVFAHVQQRKGVEWPALRQRSWARAWQIYVWFLGVIAVFVMLPSFGWIVDRGLSTGVWNWHLPRGLRVFTGEENWETLVGPLLLFEPASILPLYVWLILAAPFLLRWMQTERGRVLVLLGSALLWWIGLHVDVQRLVGNWAMPVDYRGTSFPILSWQLYFVTGLWCGVRWGEGILPAWSRRWWVVVAVLLFAIWVFLQRNHLLYNEQWLGAWIYDDNHRRHAHPLRVADALALAYLLKLGWERFRTECGIGWLALLGRHSLAIYTIQEVVIHLIGPWKPEFRGLSPWVQLPGVVLMVAFYVAIAAFIEWRRRRARQRLAQ